MTTFLLLQFYCIAFPYYSCLKIMKNDGGQKPPRHETRDVKTHLRITVDKYPDEGGVQETKMRALGLLGIPYFFKDTCENSHR